MFLYYHSFQQDSANQSLFVLFVVVFGLTRIPGPEAIAQPNTVSAIPVGQVSDSFLQAERQETRNEISHLKQPKPSVYTLDARDTLGVFVEGIFGQLDSNPPISIPDATSDLPPSIGFPVPVRENGSIDLPQIGQLPVKGLTVSQVESLVKRAYTGGGEPVLPIQNRIIVTLHRERTYRVTVVRQDLSPANGLGNNRRSVNGVSRRFDQSSRATVLQLPAYQNDVLNALLRTGGLPGLNAKSKIRIERATDPSVTTRQGTNLQFGGLEFPRSGQTQSAGVRQWNVDSAEKLNRAIELDTRLPVGAAAPKTNDIILQDGDVVYVDSRSTEVFYSGGLLNNGEHLLPRDTDLDVLEAVSKVGLANRVSNIRIQPSNLLVIRKLPDGCSINIQVDLNRALNDPNERILVAPGDTLILRHKPSENIGNVGIGVFNNYGIRQLAR